VIRQGAWRRASLLARIDRMVSTALALAFLVCGFQTGYRVAGGASLPLNVGGWPERPSQRSAQPLPVDTPVPVTEPLPQWQGRDKVNILVMGLDQRQGSSFPGRADVVMVASVDPVQRSAALISIPRDLWVEIPGHGENRINSGYFYGELDGTPGGGPALMEETIKVNLGITVDYYATLNFGCFKQIIDILGGITIDVPEPINDDRYPDEQYGYTSIHIPAGMQHMDGETALQYVRARHETSDFSRMQRQQQVLLAVRDKALKLDAVLSLPELVPLLGKTFSTDLPLKDVLALANLATQISREDIRLLVIDQSLTIPYVTADGAQVLLPRLDDIRAMLAGTLDEGSSPAPSSESGIEDARILVRADAERLGLAEEVAAFLQRRGCKAQAQKDGIRIQSETTFIASRREAAETADLISGLLQVSPEFVILGPNVEEGSDIVVTLGRSFVMPSQE
jgi:LCP family protein required for cell wall assembly